MTTADSDQTAERHKREGQIYRRLALGWMIILLCFGLAQIAGLRI